MGGPNLLDSTRPLDQSGGPSNRFPLVESKRVLITGGAGFIGSHLTEILSERNEVTIYDTFGRDSFRFLPRDIQNRVHVVKGDILDKELLGKALLDKDIVLHLAGIAGIATVSRSPIKTMEVNLKGTQNLAEALARNSTVERVLFSSTSEVYGKYAFLGKEDGPATLGSVGEPRWIYSASKIASEHLLQSYHLELGLPTTIVRLFNVYGPRQVGEGAIHNFVVAAVNEEPLRIYGDGLEIRAWCYVEDAVSGILLAVTKEAAVGRVFNIGNPRTAVAISGLAETIKRITSSSSQIIHVPKDFADVEVRVPDITLARTTLSFEPTVGLERGIALTAEWYRLHRC